MSLSKPDSDFLLPCPFCGSENVGVEPLTGGFVVDCKDCGGGCGTCHDEQAARDEWNKRKSLREILKERGIDSDKVTASIEAMVSAATPSDGGEKWKRSGDGLSVFQGNELVFNGRDTDHHVNAIRIEEMHNATLQPRDCGEERKLLYRIGRRIMECKATNEPLNIELIGSEINELLYPTKSPQRFA